MPSYRYGFSSKLIEYLNLQTLAGRCGIGTTNQQSKAPFPPQVSRSLFCFLMSVGLIILRRNLPSEHDCGQPYVISESGLEIRVCVLTYRLFYVSNTEDFLWRIPDPQEVRDASAKLDVRTAERRKWIARHDSLSVL